MSHVPMGKTGLQCSEHLQGAAEAVIPSHPPLSPRIAGKDLLRRELDKEFG